MKTKKNKNLPEVFNIFITEKCNLGCRYCFVDKTLQDKRLSFGELKWSIDEFLRYEGDKKSISFLGGEPLMEYELLKKTYNYLIAKKKDKNSNLNISLVTNGTLFSSDNVKLIERISGENNSMVKISIDGVQAAHDLNRPFCKNSNRSSFESIVKNLKKINVNDQRIAASLVISPLTIDFFLDGVKFLHQLGFSRIDFYPDMYAQWGAKDLKKMKRSFEEFAAYYVSLFNNGAGSGVFKNSGIDHLLNNEKIKGGKNIKKLCKKAHVSPDGNIYFCDKVFSLPAGSRDRYIIGSTKTGIDNEKRVKLVQKFYKKTKVLLGKKCDSCPHRNYCFCPIGHYIYFDFKKDPLNKAFGNFCRVAKVYFGGHVNSIKKLKNNKAFSDLYKF